MSNHLKIRQQRTRVCTTIIIGVPNNGPRTFVVSQFGRKPSAVNYYHFSIRRVSTPTRILYAVVFIRTFFHYAILYDMCI